MKTNFSLLLVIVVVLAGAAFAIVQPVPSTANAPTAAHDVSLAAAR